MLGFAVVAAVAVSIPFIGSLAPTSPVTDSATRIDISQLTPGTYKEFGPEYRRYFVLRDFDGQVHLFSVRRWREGYALADVGWATANFVCADFGPDSSGDRLERHGSFRCRDEEMPEWYRANLVWDYSGRNRSESIEDMVQVDFEISGDSLVFRDSL